MVVAADEAPVVVGVDGSEAGMAAVDWAADEAARHGRRLRMVSALSWEPYASVFPPVTVAGGAPEEAARQVLAEARERAAARQPGLAVSLDVLPGDAVAVLTGEARDAFLVVVGSRGRGPLARIVLGTVSLGVAARSPAATVVVRGADEAREGRYGRVVLGVDGSPHTAAAVDFAFREAEARGSVLTAVHAWHRTPGGPEGAASEPETESGPGFAPGPGPVPEDGSVIAEAVADAVPAHPGVRVGQEHIEGGARQVLLKEAETADLLVVGAHHRRGVPGLRLGLVSHSLLHHAPCPVAVVPQPRP